MTLKNHIINYGYLYNGSEIKFGIILIHVIFDVMAITKTTANLINTNGILINPNPIKLKLNCLYSTLNIGINEKNFFKLYICYKYKYLLFIQRIEFISMIRAIQHQFGWYKNTMWISQKSYNSLDSTENWTNLRPRSLSMCISRIKNISQLFLHLRQV